MDFSLKIERTFDADIVRAVMLHPALWATVAEDGQHPEDFAPELMSECWLLVSDGPYVVGVYHIHAHNAVTVEIHAQILPKKRKDHSKESARKALKWILENTTYHKVIAQIPTIYPNVKHFTLNSGFQEEGINRESYIKNGEVCDQWLLGITRPEIEAFLGEKQ